MFRLESLGFAALVVAAGCGGGGGGTDAGPDLENPGFVEPTGITRAYTESGGQWELVGDADWSCLGSPTDDEATSVEITLSGALQDFQSGEALPDASVTAYDDLALSGSGVAMASASAEGAYELTLPAGGVRWAFKVEDEGALDTYLLNQYFDPDDAEQMLNIDAVSLLTADAIPAILNFDRTQGLGILAGAIRDCSGNEVAGAIATVSSTSGAAVHLEGALSYYFAADSGLPVRTSQQADTNSNGLFVVLELPVAAEAYLQVWGFPSMAAFEAGELTLLAEIPSPILADSVVTASLQPLRTN